MQGFEVIDCSVRLGRSTLLGRPSIASFHCQTRHCNPATSLLLSPPSLQQDGATLLFVAGQEGFADCTKLLMNAW